eukprot:Lithocolla_globosa_v1_NODE_6632_length_1057_cov_45.277445.p1 type:complete len:273 gc:universal NODE_6632_length_1057_cov_45.277445:972-154(-)
MSKLIFATGLTTAGLFGLSLSMYNVEGGHRAVMFNRFYGVEQKVISEGTHFRIPYIQRPVIMDVRTRPKRIETNTPSKDMQMISITLRVLHKPRVANLPTLWAELGEAYDERVLPSIGNEILKSIVAEHDAAELITMREHVSEKIRNSLSERGESFNILFDDISIVDLTFGREFTYAVEQKQIAEQEAARAVFLVEKAQQEKLAGIIRSEGESEAALKISDAFLKHGKGLIELRRIEAQKEIAVILSKSRNVMYVPGGSNSGSPNLLLNIDK